MTLKKPVALIFRTRLLPYSETFVRNQAEAMQTFTPFYVGIRDIHGLELPADAKWIVNPGGLTGFLREVRFTFVGPSPLSLATLGALRPRLMHAHFGPDGAEAVPLAVGLGIPLIVTFHGYDATYSDVAMERTRQGMRYLSRRGKLPQQVAQFLAVSHFIKSKMEQQGFPADRIAVHYIGVDIDQFRKAATRETALRVLFTGRLTEKKGCAYLIKAMAIVQKTLPEAELIVIGDGEERETLEQQARETLTRFRFLGRQPTSVVKHWMQQATIFSVPSITAAFGDSEGFGIVFAEAQACGVPVVSFSSGGIPEAVAHGETGLLAAEGDWHQLAEYLLLLLKRGDLWNQFSDAGRIRVERLFDLKKQTAILEGIYSEIASRAGLL